MQRKLVALIMACSMTFAAIPLCVQAENTDAFSTETSVEEESSEATLFALFEGEGTKENPYILSTPQHFSYLAVLVNTGNTDYNSAYYRLSNSIDFSGFKNYIPIGKVDTEFVAETDSDGNYKTDSEGNIIYSVIETEKHPFRGHFDGNGYTIKNLTINSDARFIGIFGLGYNASVENLRVENITINAKRDYTMNIGTLFGGYEGNWQSSDLHITGCHVDGKIVVDGEKSVCIGGLVGFHEIKLNVAVVKDCRVDVDITSIAATTSYVGGMFGTVENGIDLSKSVVTGYAYGESEGDANPYTGGISARFVHDDWIGTTSGEEAVLMASSSYSSAVNLVSSIEVHSVGLYTPFIGNTFSRVTDASVSDCYYDSKYAVTGTNDSYTGTEMTTDQLFDKTFLSETIGLDFENTWTMVLGKPDLISKDPYIAYEIEGTDVKVQPVGCGNCKVVAAAYDSDGRVVASRIASYSSETPVTISLEGVSCESVKLFAFDSAYSPLCRAESFIFE